MTAPNTVETDTRSLKNTTTSVMANNGAVDESTAPTATPAYFRSRNEESYASAGSFEDSKTLAPAQPGYRRFYRERARAAPSARSRRVRGLLAQDT